MYNAAFGARAYSREITGTFTDCVWGGYNFVFILQCLKLILIFLLMAVFVCVLSYNYVFILQCLEWIPICLLIAMCLWVFIYNYPLFSNV